MLCDPRVTMAQLLCAIFSDLWDLEVFQTAEMSIKVTAGY